VILHHFELFSLSLSLSLSLARDQKKPDIHTTAREEDFFLTVNNKQNQAPTNQQPINHTVSFSLLLGQTLAHLPSITRSKSPPLLSETTTLAATANCSSKSRSAKNKRNRHKELRPQNRNLLPSKAVQSSFQKTPTLEKKQSPKSFRPQTPPPERRQKKVPKARELRVEKKKKEKKKHCLCNRRRMKKEI
jgi:hypothetical protein